MRFLIAAALAAFFTSAQADMVLDTEAGQITLQEVPCTQKAPDSLTVPYQAIATDGAAVHYGCWGRDDPFVNAWFPDCGCMAQIHQKLFKEYQGEM